MKNRLRAVSIFHFIWYTLSMEHSLITAQMTMDDWDTFWHNHMSDNFEHKAPSEYLYKRNTYRDFLRCHVKILSQNYDFVFSGHPSVFKVRSEELTEEELALGQWFFEVMQKAPSFFCLATSQQYFAGLMGSLFEDYIQYGPHDFFARLEQFNDQFFLFLEKEYLNHPIADTLIDDELWETIEVTDILDEMVETLGKKYQYQTYEAYPSAQEWYEEHRHDELTLLTTSETSLSF